MFGRTSKYEIDQNVKVQSKRIEHEREVRRLDAAEIVRSQKREIEARHCMQIRQIAGDVHIAKIAAGWKAEDKQEPESIKWDIKICTDKRDSVPEPFVKTHYCEFCDENISEFKSHDCGGIPKKERFPIRFLSDDEVRKPLGDKECEYCDWMDSPKCEEKCGE